MDPMTPTAIPSKVDRTRACRATLTGACLACLWLLVPPSASPVLAEDEKPPSSSDQAVQVEGQEQQEKKSEQPSRPAQESQAGAKSSSQPKPTPTPRARQTPRAPATPAKTEAAVAKPAAPSPTPGSALKFTDLDLEKYHRPVPKDQDDEDVEETGTEPVPGATTASGKPVPGRRPKGLTRPAVEEPGPDPLKSFKDREAKEKFRQMQITTARERIARLQERLDYLKAKRDALQNPAPLLAGQTQTQNPPAKPGEPPPPPNPVKGPGKVAIGGFFPPIPPPQTDEDKENDKKLKVKDLLDQVEKEIKSVEEEIDTARSELASVETRFAQESQSR